jgi:hypothetical protein
MSGFAFVMRLLYALPGEPLAALPREGGGEGNALLTSSFISPNSASGLECDFGFDIDWGLIFDAGVGLDIISSGSRAGRFASRAESGDGELRSGEEERGDGTCGE